MKLRNKRGNTCQAQYYTGTGADKTEVPVIVGPVTVELSQVHGEYMLNLFGRELEVVNGDLEESAPVKPANEEVVAPEQPGVNVNYKPGVGDDEKSGETAPSLTALAAQLPSRQYMCGKCRKPHLRTSGTGVSHLKYAVALQ